jgi:predicted permease
MTTLTEDLRCGLRVLRASPGVTLTAILTLALGIAASTTVFGWIDAALIDPIPGVKRGSELVSIETMTPAGGLTNTSYRDYRDYRDGLRSVSGMSASLLNAFSVGSDEGDRLIWGEFISGNYFSVLGVKALRGRMFLPGEVGDAPGGPRVAVISDALWESLFHRDPAVIGKTLEVNRRGMSIIGVAPPEFRGAVPGLALQLWIPISLGPEMNGQGPWLLNERGARQVWIEARLRPGVSVDQARAEVESAARRIAETSPGSNRGFSATALPIWKGHNGAQAVLREPLEILMAVCLVLFLIVGANVASLQLARGVMRQKEFSIRLSLGARPRRLVRQLLTESLIPAVAGAAGGVMLALWLGDALVWLLPASNLPVAFSLKLNWRILAFTTLLCAAATLLTGLVPALHSARTNLNAYLKEGSRGTTAGSSVRRTRTLLVIGEVALAVVAMVGTGLFVRSFYRLRQIDTGMELSHAAYAKYYVETFCRTPQERGEFCRRLADRLRTVPGVKAVGYADAIPLEMGDRGDEQVEVEGYTRARGETIRSETSTISPGYFDAMRIPILEGRDFREQDDRSKPVLIVNQTFARRYFGGGPAVGRRVREAGGGPWFTVVGVARDAKYRRLTETPEPHLFVDYRQRPGSQFWMALFVRTTGPAESMTRILDREAAALYPETRASRFAPYAVQARAALYAQSVAATLLGVIGGISILLAAIGLYGVLAFLVGQRTHEFGIRIALGARARHVLLPMLRQGLGLTVAGLAAGTLLAFGSMRFAATLLPKADANDPLVFAAVAAVLVLVALPAILLPARRATKVDPVVALRRE